MLTQLSHSIVTLLSDLGTRDVSVTIAKAALMGYAPDAAVVDISHQVACFDLQQAAYLLLCAYPHFPQRTIHIAMVDIFAGDIPRMLLAEKDGCFFIAPDNGVLPLTFGTEQCITWLCYEFKKPFVFSQWLNQAGVVIRMLQVGGALPFKEYAVNEVPRMLQPKVMADGIECNILCIDRYENVVLDITRPQFDELKKNRPFKVKIMRMGDITSVSNNYNDVPQGAPLCRFNNAGFMEIALNHGSAASLLGLNAGNTSNLGYRTIRIFFQG